VPLLGALLLLLLLVLLVERSGESVRIASTLSSIVQSIENKIR
jgi:hypothetical protein